MNKLVWQIPFWLFCTLFVIGLILSPYRIYLSEQTHINQLNKNISEIENKMNTLEKQLLIQKRIGAIILDDKLSSMTTFNSLQIMLFSTGNKVTFKYRIFEKCDFMGDGIIHFTKCNIVNSSLSKQLGQFITSPDSQNYDSVITFENCVFKDCNFWDICIMGNESEIKEYKQNITLR